MVLKNLQRNPRARDDLSGRVYFIGLKHVKPRGSLHLLALCPDHQYQ